MSGIEIVLFVIAVVIHAGCLIGIGVGLDEVVTEIKRLRKALALNKEQSK